MKMREGVLAIASMISLRLRASARHRMERVCLSQRRRDAEDFGPALSLLLAPLREISLPPTAKEDFSPRDLTPEKADLDFSCRRQVADVAGFAAIVWPFPRRGDCTYRGFLFSPCFIPFRFVEATRLERALHPANPVRSGRRRARCGSPHEVRSCVRRRSDACDDHSSRDCSS